ncbi:hypothetical protein Vretifemale_16234 [Volvox reticuliferus]|uniref:Uncharacterized protein n=1 Tax=Volvox reticuliferus TaxID=1737510 RepID=A0A8J4FVV5_9CHLO|nr:hypothetical protein Vretifemale_16234 [Volvox reticuliferus]
MKRIRMSKAKRGSPDTNQRVATIAPAPGRETPVAPNPSIAPPAYPQSHYNTDDNFAATLARGAAAATASLRMELSGSPLTHGSVGPAADCRPAAFNSAHSATPDYDCDNLVAQRQPSVHELNASVPPSGATAARPHDALRWPPAASTMHRAVPSPTVTLNSVSSKDNNTLAAVKLDLMMLTARRGRIRKKPEVIDLVSGSTSDDNDSDQPATASSTPQCGGWKHQRTGDPAGADGSGVDPMADGQVMKCGQEGLEG